MDKSKRPSLSAIERKAVDNLFRQNFAELINLAADDRSLTPRQPEEIVSFVSIALEQFPADTDQDFLDWASAIILPIRTLYSLKNLYSKYVFAGIWSMFRGSYTDLLNAPDRSVEPGMRPLTEIDEIAQTVWIWAFEHMQELLDPALTVSPISRLYTIAKFAARTWITKTLRQRGYRVNQKSRKMTSMTEVIEKAEAGERRREQEPYALESEPFEPSEEMPLHPASEPVEEPDTDALELTAAHENVLAFKPRKTTKRRIKADDPDYKAWGKPVTGARLLCQECKGFELKRVHSVDQDGYTALLSCGHKRISGITSTSNETLLLAA